MSGWKLIYVAHGFDLEHPRFDLIFGEPQDRKLLFFQREKKGISIRLNIGDNASAVVQELRWVADEIERALK